ncbi:group II intron maturase-specific domain-containing protein [Orientia tsutsugamushi]|uniref:group II intron maturase-specific domain-containing protein n=1 Tax=Orientia tsutsugamushi TaxID=784 RepID=UPI00352980FB
MSRTRAQTSLLKILKEIFCKFILQPIDRVIYLINQILQGWINYFRISNSSSCFRYVMDLFDKMVRCHLMQSSGLKSFC